MLKTIIILFIALIIGFLLFEIGFAMFAAERAENLIKKEHTDSINTEGNELPSLSVLFAGDSIAAGVGAPSQNLSVMGRTVQRLSEQYQVNADNVAVSGSRLEDVPEQLREAGTYDLIIVIVGSNDVLRLTSSSAFKGSLNATATALKQRSDHALIVGPGKVHTVSGVPLFMKPWYERRGKELSSLFRKRFKGERSITYISPFSSLSLPAYGPTEARDFFHPNAEGHRYWADMVEIGLKKGGIIPSS